MRFCDNAKVCTVIINYALGYVHICAVISWFFIPCAFRSVSFFLCWCLCSFLLFCETTLSLEWMFLIVDSGPNNVWLVGLWFSHLCFSFYFIYHSFSSIRLRLDHFSTCEMILSVPVFRRIKSINIEHTLLSVFQRSPGRLRDWCFSDQALDKAKHQQKGVFSVHVIVW